MPMYQAAAVPGKHFATVEDWCRGTVRHGIHIACVEFFDSWYLLPLVHFSATTKGRLCTIVVDI